VLLSPAVRRHIRLIVEYDGTDFHGWQVQAAERTVQGELQAAALAMTGEAVAVHGASRTDAGVHALGQVAHFFTSSAIPAPQFAKGLTALTPRDVAVVEADEVDAAFSARRDARGKTYRYSLWNRAAPSPLRRRTSWHVRSELDLGAMSAAARHLVGRHDFAAFRASSCDQPTTVRELTRIDVARSSEGLVEIVVEGTAFLQHMVRIITGTLVQVGLGRLEPDGVAAIRDSLDRTQAGPTAPPSGLCLVVVHY
jgi:tRNA pseudouridine38-40 synthase